MDHIKYSNIAKALLHCHRTVHSFYSDISVVYPLYMGLIKIQLFVDNYETHLDVYTEGAAPNNDNIMKMRIVNFHAINNITFEDSLLKDSYCNTANWNDESPTINYIQLNPESVKLYHRVSNKVIIDIDSIDEQHFQASTVDDIGDISHYYYMRDMYDHYKEFIPQGLGVMNRYMADEKYCNDEFRDFITKKIWGIIALA